MACKQELVEWSYQRGSGPIDFNSMYVNDTNPLVNAMDPQDSEEVRPLVKVITLMPRSVDWHQ